MTLAINPKLAILNQFDGIWSNKKNMKIEDVSEPVGTYVSDLHDHKSATKSRTWGLNSAERYGGIGENNDTPIASVAPESDPNASKRARRHAWQAKYETDFGLIAIERHQITNEVVLAMCGFCKAFGREGKYQHSASDYDPTDTKKRRRRSLTTTKFFRAFRVDNIRSHMQGAHPRRWAEYELLPKEIPVRMRYFEVPSDQIHSSNELMLQNTMSTHEPHISYEHGHFQTDNLESIPGISQHEQGIHKGTSTPSAMHPPESSLNWPPTELDKSCYADPTALAAALVVYHNAAGTTHSSFDYEQHFLDRLALNHERLEFEKVKLKVDTDLEKREGLLEQEFVEHNAQMQSALSVYDQYPNRGPVSLTAALDNAFLSAPAGLSSAIL
uniref:Uncharacterized protein AlNc14C2G300 n=1 Tax=Albugo laibachii Nc14 TaxID=890382 RepID=F0VZG2_9STRA|nr:conserved hypothetical protein [Albugo laibachii Nc14]|eukprot:CCA14192.1 conserved hypothetical protein [Albugo laibachii Nc14]